MLIIIQGSSETIYPPTSGADGELDARVVETDLTFTTPSEGFLAVSALSLSLSLSLALARLLSLSLALSLSLSLSL